MKILSKVFIIVAMAGFFSLATSCSDPNFESEKYTTPSGNEGEPVGEREDVQAYTDPHGNEGEPVGEREDVQTYTDPHGDEGQVAERD
ncbi:hypothetical protein [Fulvivirga ligni]|uniref:hypothetical protein n=1 Tax=Fulvivirga ligni TaxID=2904246 RepID=UPI001F3DE01C|nr:hypothetical protein [Fulvivirga ligni]UII20895.1 hypothetical protein LVD16_23925 [Fulvivirga ligni]